MNYTAHRQRLAAEVRAEMARQRIGLASLASASGIALSTLRRRTDGDAPFTLDELERVAKAMDTTVVSLVSLAYSPEAPAATA